MHLFRLLLLIAPLICLSFTSPTPSIVPSSKFDFSPECQTAYEEILAMRLQAGQKILHQIEQDDPNNLIPLLLANYIDLFQLFILEEEALLTQLEPNKEKRLQQLSKASPDSPYYLLSQAEINLHWAIIHLKYNQYYKAFWEVRKAYKLLKNNQSKFPDFQLNLKSLGVIHALVGTIPDNYKWGAKILGFEGDIKQGIQELEQFLAYSKQNQNIFYQEGLNFHLFLLTYLDIAPKKAWQIAQSLPTNDHLLNTLVVSEIAVRTGHHEQSIQLLENRPRGADYIDFWLLDYTLGLQKLYRLDSSAKASMLNFIHNFKGKNYVKDAYQKLAWYALLFEDESTYFDYMQKCLTYGTTNMDADKSADKWAKSGKLLHRDLLKARLLFDGGNYEQALVVLDNTPTIGLSNEHVLELNYRYGRVCEGLGRLDDAIEYYQLTMASEVGEGSYFAPKSCLQIGKIYEWQNDQEQARNYYKECFQYSDYDYENSIEQQAKAGLNRLK